MTLRPTTMRLRLSLLVVLVFGITLVAAAFVLVRQVERALVADTREGAVQQLTFELTGVSGELEGDASDEFRYYDSEQNRIEEPDFGSDPVWDAEDPFSPGVGVAGQDFIDFGFSDFVLDIESGVVVVEPGPTTALELFQVPPVIEVADTPERLTLGVPMRIGSETYIFAISRSLEPVANNLGAIVNTMWWGIPLLVGAVGLLTWFVVGRALSPIQQMASDVDGFSSTELASRVSVPQGDDEIVHMARTVNGMLDRIQSSVQQQRRFISDASHELRSPIATIGAEVEVARAHPEATDWLKTGDVVLSEQRRLSSLVDDLLLLSRFDEDPSHAYEELDLDDIVRSEIVRARPIAISQAGVSPVRMEGNRTLLGRMVGNLIANAERHASNEILVSLRKDGAKIVLTVEDDGSGIPAEERDRVFERFARLEEGRGRNAGGTGLGLAIVQGVARYHGGDVKISDSDLGGAQFTVAL